MEADVLDEDCSQSSKNNEYGDATARSRFKFKPNRKRSQHEDEDDAKRRTKSRTESPHDIDSKGHSNSGHRHKRRHRSHRPRRGVKNTFSAESKTEKAALDLDPDTAFREALFDAMADDEGAAYWEGVYGQPLHIYPTTKPGSNGELEQMTDEEYAAYVRARMYEKTHQHIFEERERRDQAREQAKLRAKEGDRLDADRRAFQVRMEESLRRGEERRSQREWKDAWSNYSKAWETLNDELKNAANREVPLRKSIQDLIPWPVKSRMMNDVGEDEVTKFFHRIAIHQGSSSIKGSSSLKAERVRWHPDKMQQRFGNTNIDVRTMKAITAVFQVIDGLYAGTKSGNP